MLVHHKLPIEVVVMEVVGWPSRVSAIPVRILVFIWVLKFDQTEVRFGGLCYLVKFKQSLTNPY